MNIKNKIFVMLIVLILSSFTTEKKSDNSLHGW